MFTALCSLSLFGFLEFLKTTVFVVGYSQASNLFPEPLTRRRRKNMLRKNGKWR